MTAMQASDQNTFMSDKDLAALGLQDLAYIKPVTIEGESVFSIHAADGTEIAVMGDIGIALATIREHDMEAVRVH